MKAVCIFVIICILALICLYGSWKAALVGALTYFAIRGVLFVIDWVIDSSERWEG